MADAAGVAGGVKEVQAAILVVDDERPIVDLLTRYLRQHGFRAVGAYAPEEARSIVAADQDIGVVISDVRMPGQSGLALAEELTRGRPETRAIEIVLISGAGLGEGADGGPAPFDVLRKPFRPSEVVSVATRALAASRERRANALAAVAAASVPLTPATVQALRTPLLPILAAAEALATGAASNVAEARAQVARIREGAMQLLALIDTAETAAAAPPVSLAAVARRAVG